MNKARPSTQIEIVEPLGKRVLIRKDEDKKTTKGGIQLPDNIEIPTITGRIVAVSAVIANDEDYPIRRYDRVLFNPKNAIPVDVEGDERRGKKFVRCRFGLDNGSYAEVLEGLTEGMEVYTKVPRMTEREKRAAGN